MLRNKRGFILILTYITIMVLAILVGGFFIRSLYESRLVSRERDAREALALAEQGIAYAIAELKQRSWTDWFTHKWTDVQTEAKLALEDDESKTPGTTAQPAKRCEYGELFVNSAAQRVSLGLDADTYKDYIGHYFVNDPTRFNANRIFFVKTYPDYRPDISDLYLQKKIQGTVVVIRSIGIVNQTKRALEQRLSRGSLYEYLYFYPRGKVFENGTFDGGTIAGNFSVGKIHVNGNIGLRCWASFKNMRTLSCSGKIYQDYARLPAPVFYDRHAWANEEKKWFDDTVDKAGEYMKYNIHNGYAPAPIFDLDYYFYHTKMEAPDNPPANPFVEINGVKLPFRAENIADEMYAGEPPYPVGRGTYFNETWEEWPWKIYEYGYYDRYEDGGALRTEQRPVKLTVPEAEFRSLEKELGLEEGDIENQADYWNARYGGTRPVYVSEVWWNDPDNYNYGTDPIHTGQTLSGSGEDTFVNVRYLDTEQQADDWKNWVNNMDIPGDPLGRKLADVVKDGITGGAEGILAPELRENYFRKLAAKEGIYIGLDANNKCINTASTYAASAFNINQGDDPFSSSVTFFKHPLYPAQATDKKTYVFTIDVGELTQNVPQDFNGIVFIDLTLNPKTGTVQEAIDHDYTVRLENARRLYRPITFVSLRQNVQLKGDFNTNPNWQPAAVITYKRIETLSKDFDKNGEFSRQSYGDIGDGVEEKVIRPPYYNRYDSTTGTRYTYPRNCQKDNIFLQNYVYDELKPPDWNKFGIAPQDRPSKAEFTWDWVKTNIPDSRHQRELATIGQNVYYQTFKDYIIPEVTTDTTYNVALVTPYPPEAHVLERWKAKRIFKGAFIRLSPEKAIEAESEKIGITNCALQDNSLYRRYSPYWRMGYIVDPGELEATYDVRFLDSEQRPPGDIYAASESSWGEISSERFLDLSYVSPPTSPPITTTPPPGGTPWWKLYPWGIYVPETTEPPPPAPNADFNASPKSGELPLTVNFTDQSTGDIDSWQWDLGDVAPRGGWPTTPDTTWTYKNAGNYTVSLTVTGPGGSDTAKDVIKVFYPPPTTTPPPTPPPTTPSP